MCIYIYIYDFSLSSAPHYWLAIATWVKLYTEFANSVITTLSTHPVFRGVQSTVLPTKCYHNCPLTKGCRVPCLLTELSSSGTEPPGIARRWKRSGLKHSICWKATRLQPESCPNFWKDCKWQPGQYLWHICSLPQVAENVRAVRSGLLWGARRTAVVDRSPVCLERQDHHDGETFTGDRVRCLNLRLGVSCEGSWTGGPCGIMYSVTVLW